MSRWKLVKFSRWHNSFYLCLKFWILWHLIFVFHAVVSCAQCEWCLVKYRKIISIPHASYLVTLPPKSTEKDCRHIAGRKKKKKRHNTNNWTAGNWRKIILREKPFHMLLTRCQPFHKYASCRMEENVWKFSLCEILNGNYRQHVFSTQELETINLVPVKGKLTSKVSTRQGYQTQVKSLRTEAYEILSLQGSIILSQHTIQKFSKD